MMAVHAKSGYSDQNVKDINQQTENDANVYDDVMVLPLGNRCASEDAIACNKKIASI